MEGWKSKQTVAAKREREGLCVREREREREEGRRSDLFAKFFKFGCLAHCCLRRTHGWTRHRAEL